MSELTAALNNKIALLSFRNTLLRIIKTDYQPTYVQVRDYVRMIWGSVINWLEQQPTQRLDYIADTVVNTVAEIKQKNKFETSIWAFSAAIENGKIGYTLDQDDGSYCYEAIMAYKVFYQILKSIMVKYEIGESEREMPLYPVFDSWVLSGYYINELKEELDESTSTDRQDEEKSSDVDKYMLKTLILAIDTKYTAHRKKVTSCCEVCRLLDEACQAEQRNIKKHD